jgi:hypothetical protein
MVLIAKVYKRAYCTSFDAFAMIILQSDWNYTVGIRYDDASFEPGFADRDTRLFNMSSRF